MLLEKIIDCPTAGTWDVALSVSFVYLFSLLVLVVCVNSTNTYISVVSFDINGSLICDNDDADGDDGDGDDDDDEEKHGANISV